MAEIDVLVVAPDKPQSGIIHNKQHLIFKQNFKENDVIEYSCSGTPVDVKLAVNEIKKESRICACLALIMDLTLPSM
jgi:broad specificity polyphosphatase/5'/3'-nucleotidase SurE